MKNTAASVRAKLLNLSRAEGVPLNILMEQYATGRFLYRLAESKYSERFVLKGTQLFRIWGAEKHRPTRDLDLLGYGEASEEAIQKIFSELVHRDIDPPDGLEWGEVTVASIRDDAEYGGVRAKVNVDLAGARLGIQVDVGFGDAITPAAIEKDWHELLPFPKARLLVYPPETGLPKAPQFTVRFMTSRSGLEPPPSIPKTIRHRLLQRNKSDRSRETHVRGRARRPGCLSPR